MGNFRQNNRRDNSDFSDRRNNRPDMHRAVCDECGKNCEVPFKPSNDKPIYCNECFGHQGRGSESRDFSGRDSRNTGKFNSKNKQMFSAVCDECGDNCEVPFRPTNDKPIYCSYCFDKPGDNKNSHKHSEKIADNSAEIEKINAKLDKILELIEKNNLDNTKSTFKEVKAIKKETKEKKKVAVKKQATKKVATKEKKVKKTTATKTVKKKGATTKKAKATKKKK